MIHRSMRFVAPLGLLAFLLPFQEKSRPLDAAVTQDGALFTLESTGARTLDVRVLRGSDESRTSFTLDSLQDDAKIIDARVVPFTPAGGDDAVVLAMVIEHGDSHTYRFLHNHYPSDDQPFTLSGPIFESQGEPFRIVEARATGSSADGLEITFRRGKYSIRGENSDVEEFVYIDTCSLAGLAGSKLHDVRTHKQTSPR